jgi:hypothetical protein
MIKKHFNIILIIIIITSIIILVLTLNAMFGLCPIIDNVGNGICANSK